MYALDFYTSVCRNVMSADSENEESWSDLRRSLPCLRQSLGCYVCFQILQDPVGPNHNVCKHFVCKQCVGGKMKLKPSCSWCKDHWSFVPNAMLQVLVTCFKKLCVYIYCSPLGQAIANSCVNGETNTLLTILHEGIEFSNSDMPSVPAENPFDPNPFVPLTKIESEIDEPSTSGVQHSPLPGTEICEESDIQTQLPEVEENICSSSFRSSRNLHKKKVIKKSVRFIKKAAQVKSQKRFKSLQVKTKKCLRAAHSPNKKKSKRSRDDGPDDLEKIDISQPASKKVKPELHPPELKPLSSCNCGKSGNFNQLTCIGQRCPCYSMKLPCMGTCKCRGCRNPKKGPDYYQDNHMCSSAVLRSGTRSTTESLM